MKASFVSDAMPLQQISVKDGRHGVSDCQEWKGQEPVYTATGTNPAPPERCTSRASTLSNGYDICRICHCEGEGDAPLIAPCYCAGSLRYVHQACLQQWIKSSDIRCCELCKFQFIMYSKIKPITQWEQLELSALERRRLMCSVLFHTMALTCVMWSLYVLIDRTLEEINRGLLEWPLWIKLIVVTIGFTGGLSFMYIQGKFYCQLCRRWRAFNRVIYVQNAPEKVALDSPINPSNPSNPPNPQNPPPQPEGSSSLLGTGGCCGIQTESSIADVRDHAPLPQVKNTSVDLHLQWCSQWEGPATSKTSTSQSDQSGAQDRTKEALSDVRKLEIHKKAEAMKLQYHPSQDLTLRHDQLATKAETGTVIYEYLSNQIKAQKSIQRHLRVNSAKQNGASECKEHFKLGKPSWFSSPSLFESRDERAARSKSEADSEDDLSITSLDEPTIKDCLDSRRNSIDVDMEPLPPPAAFVDSATNTEIMYENEKLESKKTGQRKSTIESVTPAQTDDSSSSCSASGSACKMVSGRSNVPGTDFMSNQSVTGASRHGPDHPADHKTNRSFLLGSSLTYGRPTQTVGMVGYPNFLSTFNPMLPHIGVRQRDDDPGTGSISSSSEESMSSMKLLPAPRSQSETNAPVLALASAPARPWTVGGSGSYFLQSASSNSWNRSQPLEDVRTERSGVRSAVSVSDQILDQAVTQDHSLHSFR